MIFSKLNEETLGDRITAREAEKAGISPEEAQEINAAAVQLDDAEIVGEITRGDIEEACDDALKAGLRAQRTLKKGGDPEFPALLLVGEAGTGKTSRVKDWAKKKGINCIVKLTSTMDDTDLGGAVTADKNHEVAVRLASTEFDGLDEPNSILFLDEYNRGSGGVRQTLLNVINDHWIPDVRQPGSRRYFPNLLFVVCAMNPDTEGYNTGDSLDRAERSRLYRVDVKADPRAARGFFKRKFEFDIKNADDEEEAREAEGRLKLSQTLLTHPSFKFDDAESTMESEEVGNGQILNSRTLAKLLDMCDGTKEDFLKRWDRICNSLKKPMAERILADYKDVEDKANDALKYGDAKPVFQKKEKSDWDDVSSQLGI